MTWKVIRSLINQKNIYKTNNQIIDQMERRDFLKNSSAVMAGTIILPTIVPSTVFGKNAPSNKINVAQIGFGRIAMTHDLAETLPIDAARVIAVADLDANRAAKGTK